MSGGAWGLGHRVGDRWLRMESGLTSRRRRTLQIQRDALLAELEALDTEAAGLAARRAEIVGSLADAREMLYPPVSWAHLRIPRIHDQPRVPTPPDDAIAIAGADLRELCCALIAANGAATLAELHRRIHLAGYAVASPRPVQRLADAVAYEARAGRLVRVSRGVYGSAASDSLLVRYGRARQDLDRPSEDPLSRDPPWKDPPSTDRPSEDARPSPPVAELT
jgi:hypothetical protein